MSLAEPLLHQSELIGRSQNLHNQRDIENLVKAEVFKNQIRLKEFFQDFDKLRKGKVTEDKFRSALACLKIHLTEENIQQLLDRYRGEDGLIKWVEFVDNVEAQFYDHSLGRTNLQLSKIVRTFTKEEEILVGRILHYIRLEIKNKRIVVKPSFQDFDRYGTCHVTVEQFARVLTKLGIIMPESHFRLLARRYEDKDSNREVNYYKFLDEVEDKSLILSREAPPDLKKSSYIDQPIIDDVARHDFVASLYVTKKLSDRFLSQDVIQRIKNEVVVKQVRIKELFKDVDVLRKGVCTEAQFRRILNQQSVNITDEDMFRIAEYFSDAEKNIKYLEFCEEIDTIFTRKGIEKTPTFEVPPVPLGKGYRTDKKYFEMDQTEKEILEEVLRIYKSEIQNRRILLKPRFQDFDRVKNGYVTKNQFLRVLNCFELYPSDRMINILLKRYIDKGNLDEVNYFDFCRDVDEVDPEIAKKYEDHFTKFKLPQMGKSQLSASNTLKAREAFTFEEIVKKIRRKVKEERIRIDEFLRDYDKLRCGFITPNQFRQGLDLSKLILSENEYQIILKYFNKPGKGPTSFPWLNFVDYINEVFTIKGLEKNPMSKVEAPDIKITNTTKCTPTEIDLVEKVKNRFRYYCLSTRLDVKQFFQDWDKLGRNKVFPKQMRQVLTTVKFDLTEDEFKALVKYYGTEDLSEVKYVDFIIDTNPGNAFEMFTLNKSTDTIKLIARINVSANNKNIDGDLNDILDKIRRDVKIHRKKTKEYFQDYDPLRKGIIPKSKFFGCLDKQKIELTPREMKILGEFYQDVIQPDKILYLHFCEDIDIVFRVPSLEKDPLQDPNPPKIVNPSTIVPKVSNEKSLHEILEELGSHVKVNRVLLKTYFQDSDVAKSGKVSFQRFRSVLDFLNIKITDQAYNLLCERFTHQGKEFNYVEFCNTVQAISEKY